MLSKKILHQHFVFFALLETASPLEALYIYNYIALKTWRKYKPPLTLLCFYLGFLSQILTIHKTAEEEGGYVFNSSLPPQPTLGISGVIAAEG